MWRRIEEWYFQDAASTNAESIIFLHEYVVMCYVVSIIILMSFISYVFTWKKNIKIYINFWKAGKLIYIVKVLNNIYSIIIYIILYIKKNKRKKIW